MNPVELLLEAAALQFVWSYKFSYYTKRTKDAAVRVVQTAAKRRAMAEAR